ncbi:hypothetical protein FPZ43_18895 [Mucilaginibacter pallidiroseus]|uniref:Uncharacterized protein n=1 Tax=Mucilaginibacter pallidiroseus TaxID=2599295 RepID=A0A563TXN0_9SPHI|nr:hypothetical protein [Mucilaginibacter pallidiroseus]TWR24076.1 hypothetical protein FPZ43_18895 [Mucilaginibacter pallidiroseus]
MKIITLHKPVNKNAVFNHIKENLNSQFKQQRQSDITFDIENKPEAIEIWQPEFYDGALFTIVVQDDELWITRNEHYVDDVNSVTLESILNGLFNDLSGGLGTDLVEEG